MNCYLLQKDYDEAVELFIIKIIDYHKYCDCVNYYEHPKVIELFTINLN